MVSVVKAVGNMQLVFSERSRRLTTFIICASHADDAPKELAGTREC